MRKILFIASLVLLFSGCGKIFSDPKNPLRLTKPRNVDSKLIDWVRYNDDLFDYFTKSRSKIDGLYSRLMSTYEVSKGSGITLTELKMNKEFNDLMVKYNAAVVIDDHLIDHMISCYTANKYSPPPPGIRRAIGKTRREELEELRKIKNESSGMINKEFNISNRIQKTLDSLKKIGFNSQRTAVEWDKIHDRFRNAKIEAEEGRDRNLDIAQRFLNSDFEDKNKIYNNFNVLQKKFDEIYREICTTENQLSLTEYVNKCQEVSGASYQVNRLNQLRTARIQNLNTLNNDVSRNYNSRYFDQRSYIKQYNDLKMISDSQTNEENRYVRSISYLIDNKGEHIKKLEDNLNLTFLSSSDIEKMKNAKELLASVNFTSLKSAVSKLSDHSEEARIIESIYKRLVREAR